MPLFFSAIDFVVLILDDVKQQQTHIASISTNDITLDDAVPSPAARGNTLVKAVVLAGNTDIGVSVINYAGLDEMYFCIGADTAKKFEGSECIDILILQGSIFVDIFVEDTEFTELYAAIRAHKILETIPNSFIGKVKRLPHGSERTWDEGKEINQ